MIWSVWRLGCSRPCRISGPLVPNSVITTKGASLSLGPGMDAPLVTLPSGLGAKKTRDPDQRAALGRFICYLRGKRQVSGKRMSKKRRGVASTTEHGPQTKRPMSGTPCRLGLGQDLARVSAAFHGPLPPIGA